MCFQNFNYFHNEDILKIVQGIDLQRVIRGFEIAKRILLFFHNSVCACAQTRY